jgi:hypothetical protein
MGFQASVTAPKVSINAQHWLRRAEEARQIAEMVNDSDVREKLLDLAKTYEKLANRASANELQIEP